MAKMYDSIRKIALRLLKEDVIVASWGITNVELFESHISFHVNGLKYSGMVEVKAKDCDEYEILLDGASIGKGHLDSIVNIIDNAVEKTDCYQQRLEEWINNQLKG
ncbi:MAG: hypothetical protein J5801_01370 [Bacteroidales bacterium]|nr:hypothetical protein [Bacteroidales bacterium]